MPQQTYSDFFSPASTAHNQIDQLIGELGDPGSIRAADPWWNMYGQAKESVGDWLGEMLPPSPGIEPGTPRYESAEENIQNLFGLIPQEKWELPLYALGGAGSLKKGKKLLSGAKSKKSVSDYIELENKIKSDFFPNLFSPVASGTKGASKLHKTAKKVFGTTDDYTKGGYIIEDGSMLDWVKGGTRSVISGKIARSHGEIRNISDPTLGGLQEYKNIDKFDFMNSGAVRIRTFGGATPEEMRYLKVDPSDMPNWFKKRNEQLFIFDMNTMPNSEQFRKMQKIYNDVIGKGSKVQVSARTVAPANVLWRQKEYQMGRNPDWENSLDVEYDIKNSWNKVKNDIIKYFETGRGPSTVQQFR